MEGERTSQQTASSRPMREQCPFCAFLSKKDDRRTDMESSISNSYKDICIYTFNGKEKDYESGLHYYGARYYDCELLTGWLSVDPIADKYPSLSPYNYCAWNPVKLVDPDGRKIDSIAPGLERLVNIIRNDDPGLYKQLNESSDVYRIVYNDKNDGSGGAFSYVPNADAPSNGYLEISILPDTKKYGEFSEMEKLAHEMRHAKQYEDGQLGFKVQNGMVEPIGYDINDEVECYEYADRYANVNFRKSHNQWVSYVRFSYPNLHDSQRPKTPLAWVDKTYNTIKGLYQDPAQIVSKCNAWGKRNVPYFKIHQ